MDAGFDRGLHINLDEIADGRAHFVADGAIRGNRRGDCRSAVPRQYATNETDAANIFVAVLFAETQPLAKMLAHHVPIQHFDAMPALAQFVRK